MKQKHGVGTPLEIEQQILAPVGSLTPGNVRFLADSVYHICTPNNVWVPRAMVAIAEKVFLRLLEEKQCTIPTKLSTTLIRSVARNGDFNRAKSILDTLIQQHKNNPELHPAPTDYYWSTAIYGCAQNASDRALHVAESLVAQAEASGIATIEMYNNLLLLLSRRSHHVYGSAAAAEDLLLKLSAQAAEDSNALEPNAQTFNLVLRAWSLAPEKEGAARADTILQILVRVGEPDLVAFGTVISAYGKRGLIAESERVLKQAVRVLGTQSDLTEYWDEVCTAWSRIGNLDQLKQLMHDTPQCIRPSRRRHQAYLQCLLKKGMSSEAETHVLEIMPLSESEAPTLYECNMLLEHYCSNMEVKKATFFLKKMISLSIKRGCHCVPEVSQYSIVLRGWATVSCPDNKRGKVVARLLAVLDLAETHRSVDATCYRIVIKALCDYNRPVEAVDVLRRMEKQADDGIIRWPPFAADLYTIVFAVLYRQRTSESALQALELLRTIQRTGQRATPHSVKDYNLVLSALSKLPKEKPEITLELFAELREMDNDPNNAVKLDPAIFEKVLWNLVGGRKSRYALHTLRILNIIIAMLENGRKDLQPTQNSFNAVIKSLHEAGERDKCISLVRDILDRKARNVLAELPSRHILEHVTESFDNTYSDDSSRALRNLVARMNNDRNTEE